MWTNGPRIECGEVERHSSGSQPMAGPDAASTSGRKKEIFDAETFAIYHALPILDRRQESGHQYTVFVSSTAAIDRFRTDALGPGQRFAIAAMEVCGRVFARDNEVTTRWFPANSRVAGNEQADSYAKAAARRTAPHNDDDDVPEALLVEASLSHMSRSTTEARSRASAAWIASHIRSQRRYRPSPRRRLRRQHLRNTRKDFAGRYCHWVPCIRLGSFPDCQPKAACLVDSQDQDVHQYLSHVVHHTRSCPSFLSAGSGTLSPRDQLGVGSSGRRICHSK